MQRAGSCRLTPLSWQRRSVEPDPVSGVSWVRVEIACQAQTREAGAASGGYMPVSEPGSPPADPARRTRTPPRCRVTTPPKIGKASSVPFVDALARPGHVRRPPPALAAGSVPVPGVARDAARGTAAATDRSRTSRQPRPHAESTEGVHAAPPLDKRKVPSVEPPAPPPVVQDPQAQADPDNNLAQSYADWWTYGL
eukprot:COSAG03_NODE_1473_length_4019_cov_1.826531_4_plen_196_part_00